VTEAVQKEPYRAKDWKADMEILFNQVWQHSVKIEDAINQAAMLTMYLIDEAKPPKGAK